MYTVSDIIADINSSARFYKPIREKQGNLIYTIFIIIEEMEIFCIL